MYSVTFERSPQPEMGGRENCLSRADALSTMSGWGGNWESFKLVDQVDIQTSSTHGRIDFSPGECGFADFLRSGLRSARSSLAVCNAALLFSP